MDEELSRLDRLFFHGFFDELPGKDGEFPVGHHPPHYIATPDIQDDVEAVIGPLHRSLELGYILGPYLIGTGGKKLRFGVVGTNQLISPLLRFPFLFQNPVHGADRAEVALFIQQGCIDFPRRLVHKAVFMEEVGDRAPFRRRKGKKRSGTYFLLCRFLPSVETGTGYVEGMTGSADTNIPGKGRQLPS